MNLHKYSQSNNNTGKLKPEVTAGFFCNSTTNELAAPHQAVYEIHSASSSDEGSYICHASSRVGTTEERVYIRVEDINVRVPIIVL